MTKKNLLLLLPITLWSITGSAYALDCKNITASAQIDICATVEKENADNKLNDSYKKLTTRIKEQYAPEPEMGERYLSTLRNSQRAWTKHNPDPRGTRQEEVSAITDCGNARPTQARSRSVHPPFT